MEEWSTSHNPGSWHINQGDTDVVYLVQVGSDLYLLQWLGEGVTPEEELSLFSTVFSSRHCRRPELGARCGRRG